MPFSIPRIASALLLGLALTASAQAQGNLGADWTAPRAELERRAEQLDALAASTAYSERARERARGEAAQVRRRLTEGDFRVGDRIYLEIESGGAAIAGAAREDLRDTLTVLDGVRIAPRGVGEIALAGVLRSELQARVTAAVSEVILNARATARPLVRLAVFGAVGRPGYFTVALETRVDALLMLAGGPTVEASTDEIRIVRGDTTILDETEVRQAIAAGDVVAMLGLQEGDQLFVERRPTPVDRTEAIRLSSLLIAPVVSALVFRLLR